MGKLPAFQFYPGDWLRDPVSGCSIGAQGLWLRMMMLMHDSQEYGYLSLDHQPIPPVSVARRCACTVEEYESLLSELFAAGVPSRTLEGVIYCRRMVREGIERDQARERKRRQRRTNVTQMSRDCHGVSHAPVTALSEDEEEDEVEVEFEVSSLKENGNSATKLAPHFDLEAYWQRLLHIYNKPEKSAFTQQTYVLIVDGDEVLARLIEARAALYVKAKGNFTVGLGKFLTERIFEQNPEVWSNGNGSKASREARTRAIAEQVAFESDVSPEDAVQKHH